MSTIYVLLLKIENETLSYEHYYICHWSTTLWHWILVVLFFWKKLIQSWIPQIQGYNDEGSIYTLKMHPFMMSLW